MDTLDFTKHYSYADYLLWKFEERLELIRGKVFKMSPAPSSNHQYVATELTFLIVNEIKKQDKPCKVFTAPFDVRLPRKSKKDEKITTVLQPDLCVICDTKKIDKRGCLGAPDLVVEILSPGNSSKEMNYKYDVYEESGVREYWIIDYQKRSLLIYILNEKGVFQGLKPVVEGQNATSYIFKEFSFKLDIIFPEKDFE